MTVVIIMGSEVDKPHVSKIEETLDKSGTSYVLHMASAHKSPKRVLEILEHFSDERKIVYITVAGRSNALSGFVAANSRFPTLACPPFADKMDMMVNIHSTLQMPSAVPVMTVLDPANCAMAAIRILDL
tara:strand:- start:158 stop:544 length:387 start_codon:yes stop_codon:yes gene_type:complete